MSVTPRVLTLSVEQVQVLEAEACRRSLRTFVERAWHSVEPGKPFVAGKHIDAVCQHLEAVSKRQIRKLLINIPPRAGKSTIVSVLWPAWEWTNRPHTQWLFASYAAGLSLRDAVRFRRLLESPWYRRLFGEVFALSDDQNTKSRIDNDRSGYRFSTSVGGGVTGDGGDIQVIDDAHNAKDVLSDVKRESVLDWYANAWSTRVNDPSTSARVVVGQRLHERDLPGVLLEEGGWDTLVLPAEYEADHPRPPTSLGWVDWRQHDGEVLWPGRYGARELADLKRALGSYAIAAQLQQRPAPLAGGLFKRSWWQTFDVAPTQDAWQFVGLSVDATFSESGSSYVAIQTLGEIGSRIYVLDQVRERMGFTDTLRTLVECQARARERYGRCDAVLVEEKANGAALLDVLKGRVNGLVAIKVSDSKEQRAVAASPRVEAGDIVLPASAPWRGDFELEFSQFPRGANDDQVDALTQWVLWRGRNTTPDLVISQALLAPRPSPWK